MNEVFDLTRVKVDDWKKTVSVTLPQNLVKRARKHNLNKGRITEKALSSILNYLETQTIKPSLKPSYRRFFSGRNLKGR